jgi:hypothetical protein
LKVFTDEEIKKSKVKIQNPELIAKKITASKAQGGGCSFLNSEF